MLKEIWKYAKLFIAMVLGNIVPYFIMIILYYEIDNEMILAILSFGLGFLFVSVLLAWIIFKMELPLAKSEVIIYIPMAIVAFIEAIIDGELLIFGCSVGAIKFLFDCIDYNGVLEAYDILTAFIYPVFQLLAILLFYYLFKFLDKHKKLKNNTADGSLR